jgi:hypothetical protein
MKVTDASAFPAFVRCRFYDARGVEHVIHEKMPIVTPQNISANGVFPQNGIIRCILQKERTDDKGRKILTVSTELPDHVETVNGLFVFDLLEDQFAGSESAVELSESCTKRRPN